MGPCIGVFKADLSKCVLYTKPIPHIKITLYMGTYLIPRIEVECRTKSL